MLTNKDDDFDDKAELDGNRSNDGDDDDYGDGDDDDDTRSQNVL